MKFDYRDLTNEPGTAITNAFRFARLADVCGRRGGQKAGGALWFRGQTSSEWPLLPAIGRETVSLGERFSFHRGDLLKAEYRLLHNFRRNAHAFFGRELSLWETIIVAQHHGLPTRLLDWTSNPLIGLYFAVDDALSGSEVTDGAIFIFRPRTGVEHFSIYQSNFVIPKLGEEPTHLRDPLRTRGVKIVYPSMSTGRLISQSGSFTIQSPDHSLEALSAQRFESDELDVFDMEKRIVPARYKAQIIRQLERVAISRRTLFPDLDGLGAGLFHTEILRAKPAGAGGES